MRYINAACIAAILAWLLPAASADIRDLAAAGSRLGEPLDYNGDCYATIDDVAIRVYLEMRDLDIFSMDVDGDGVVTSADTLAALRAIIASSVGDVSQSQVVDSSDLAQAIDQMASGSYSVHSDTNIDGTVDHTDLGVVLDRFGAEISLDYNAIAFAIYLRLEYASSFVDEHEISHNTAGIAPCGLASSSWPRNHSVTVSSGWPDGHDKAYSIYYPANHTFTITAGWEMHPPSGTHSKANSNSIKWPANHSAAVSKEWPHGPDQHHNNFISNIWPPNPNEDYKHSNYWSSMWPPQHGLVASSSFYWPVFDSGDHSVYASTAVHAVEVSNAWPAGHTASVSETNAWPADGAHSNVVSSTYPPSHTATVSGQWPPIHTHSLSAAWGTHLIESSVGWPTNHPQPISSTWPPNTYPPSNWPPNHLMSISGSWGDPPQHDKWFPPGHTYIPSAKDIKDLISPP